MFYLLVVVFAAIRWGMGTAIFTAIASVIVFDFFLIPPYLTLTVDDIQYVFTFTAFLIVGIVVSTLASKVREQVLQRQTEKLHAALLDSISHDMKTPLVSITGTLSVLLEEASNLSENQRRELLATAATETYRLHNMVSNLLDMTKMEAGCVRLEKKPADMNDLIGVSLEQLRDVIGTRVVSVDMPKFVSEIAVDFSLLVKAFKNVIENALKYSLAERPVEIMGIASPEALRIEVRDHGCGISKEDLPHVFEKFYRGKLTHDIPGTGLGLCVAKSIIEAHGGSIIVTSEPGVGSVFTIELPRA